MHSKQICSFQDAHDADLILQRSSYRETTRTHIKQTCSFRDVVQMHISRPAPSEKTAPASGPQSHARLALCGCSCRQWARQSHEEAVRWPKALAWQAAAGSAAGCFGGLSSLRHSARGPSCTALAALTPCSAAITASA